MLITNSSLQTPFFPFEKHQIAKNYFRHQLLKWIGNKQRMAFDIINYFPNQFETYYEPFLGSGAVLGVLAPSKAVASDNFFPLIEIWKTLHKDKEFLKNQYLKRYNLIKKMGKKEAYNFILSTYNKVPNGADLLFLSRTCYGGVIRFRKADGYMSTPVGAHNPMPPENFFRRVDLWHERIRYTKFIHADFADVMRKAKKGDMIYCDPPYTDSQTILYGAQSFSFNHLLQVIEECKSRGVYVALSIDGTKNSGRKLCNINIPQGLFKNEIFMKAGQSMLKRFQMDGRCLKEHEVSDRLLLTY